MKKGKNLLEQLKPLPFFSKDIILQIGKQVGIKNTTTDTYISRFMKYKEILQFRKGLYVTADFFEKNKGDLSYSFYLANIMRTPSYVSSWSALQYYNMTTEAIYGITSVTPKVTRRYKTKAGSYVYHSIRKDLFTDFYLKKAKFDFFIASPSKALFDLLYFKTYQFRGIRLNEITAFIEELRIDIDEMGNKEKKLFYSILRKNIP